MHRKSTRKLTFNVIVYILVVVCTILSLFPTFFAFLLAVLKEKNANAMYEDFTQIFTGFTWENFKNVLEGSNLHRRNRSDCPLCLHRFFSSLWFLKTEVQRKKNSLRYLSLLYARPWHHQLCSKLHHHLLDGII